jgi:N-acetylglucosaminyl-diphospho-decaprenol L-rhamnosyltransferase
MPAGTVVIVTHNSGGCIGACLKALAQSREWKVVVVDNDSKDDTVQKAQAVSHGVHLLINSRNAGFAGAVNQAVKIAEGNYLAILNPDVIPTGGSMDQLARTLESDAVGAAGGVLMGEDGLPQKGFTVRRFPTLGSMLTEVLLLNRIWPRNPWNVAYRCLSMDYQAVQEVDQPAGACLAIKREAWEAVNGFDESFFPVWFEDVDFCRRLRDQGWKILYCPDAIFLHAGGHSVNRLSFRDRQRYWYGNLLRYFVKHHSRTEVGLLRAGILVGTVLRALLSLIGFGHKGMSVAETLRTYWHVGWHYAVRGEYQNALQPTSHAAQF